MVNEIVRSKGTHMLESGDGERSQNGKHNEASDRYSRPIERRRRDKSELEKKSNKRRARTTWRAQTEGQVKMTNETEGAMGTHQLESADEETS
jgi:hypothetical protein